jgi:integration host factor subunit alpha
MNALSTRRSESTVYVHPISQRMDRNPKTGKDAIISARRVTVFKPSPILKERIKSRP